MSATAVLGGDRLVAQGGPKTVPMPTTTDMPPADRMPRGEPVGTFEGAPVYSSGDAPAYLRSQSQLTRARLKITPSQVPVAYIYTRWWGDRVGLYDPHDAVRMRPLGSTTKRAMAARRTCPACGEVRQHIVRGGQCGECRLAAWAVQERLAARTCAKCRSERKTPFPRGRRRVCGVCLRKEASRRREEAARWLRNAMTCRASNCEVQVATEEQVRAEETKRGYRYWPFQMCPGCEEREAQRDAEHRRRQREEEQRRREARARQERALEAWATAALADSSVCVLDTETTGLGDEACIVEIAVISASGDVLLNTLVNPRVPIPAEATAVHGITDAMVNAPGVPTFPEILDQLDAALTGRRCLIWNDTFDRARMRWELIRHHEAANHPEPSAAAQQWLASHTFEDAMEPYSDWVGEPHWSYEDEYRWQPLNGDHRALGDCRTVLIRLGEMRSAVEEVA